VGHQAIFFAIFVKTFSISQRLLPEDPRMVRFFKIFDLEKGLILGPAPSCWDWACWCGP